MLTHATATLAPLQILASELEMLLVYQDQGRDKDLKRIAIRKDCTFLSVFCSFSGNIAWFRS